MAIEITFINPVANAILNLLKIGNGVWLAQEAETKIREAIQGLLLENSYENKAEAVILAAEAVRLLSPDVLLAGKMLKKVRKKNKATRKKLVTRKVEKNKLICPSQWTHC